MADQWINQQEIKSGTSSRVYVVSQNARTGLYGCSCPGWRTHRKCKHLTSMGLPTEEPITVTRTPVRVRTTSVRSVGDFVDTPKHYDVTAEGLGNPDEWRQKAANLAKGRGTLRQPTTTKVDGRPADSKLIADMALVGITALPNTADELLAAMKLRAEALNHPVTGNPDQFWRMFAAYERLMEDNY